MGNLISVREFCRRANIHNQTGYALIKNGTLPSVKIGKLIRIDENDVTEFLEARKILIRP